MPRDAKATLSDGTVETYQGIPDSVSPDEFIARVQKDTGKKVVGYKGGDGEWKRVAADGAPAQSGILDTIKGLAIAPLRGLANTAADTGAALANAHDIEAGNPVDPSQYRGAGELVQKALPVNPNEGPIERYVRKGLEGSGGAVAGLPAGGPVRTLISGGLAGLLGEVGRSFAGVPGEIAGNLAAGGVGSVGAGLKKNSPQLAAEMLNGVAPSEIATAIANMRGARALPEPINLDLSQAMPRPSNIDAVRDALAGSKFGAPVVDTLRAQPGQVSSAITAAAKRLPGAQLTPQEIENAAQSASTSVIKDASAASGRLAAIPAGTRVGLFNLFSFDHALEQYAKDNPTIEAAGMANAVREKLQLPPIPGAPAIAAAPLGSGLVSKNKIVPGTPAGAPTPVPRTDANELKAGIDEVLQSYGANALGTGAQSKDLNRYAAQIREIRNQTLFPPGSVEAKGRALASASYAQTVDPLEKSVIGRIAGPKGAVDDAEAPARLLNVFAKGTPVDLKTGRALGGSEILTAQRVLAQKDPGIFIDAAKTYIANKLSGLKADTTGAAASDVASQVKTLLAPDAARQQGLKDILAGVARSQGIPDAQVVKPFMQLMDYVAMAEKRPGIVSAASEAARAAESSGLASSLQVWTPGRIGDRIKLALSRDAYQTVGKLLDTPEGVTALKRMADSSLMSPQTQSALGAFFGSLGSSEPTKGQ